MNIIRRTVFAQNRSATCNRCFPGPTRVMNANGIAIASNFFAGLTIDDRSTDHATRSFAIGGIYLRIKGKERKSIYIAPFVYYMYVYLKALMHGSHSFTCKYTMLAFPS